MGAAVLLLQLVLCFLGQRLPAQHPLPEGRAGGKAAQREQWGFQMAGSGRVFLALVTSWAEGKSWSRTQSPL